MKLWKSISVVGSHGFNAVVNVYSYPRKLMCPSKWNGPIIFLKFSSIKLNKSLFSFVEKFHAFWWKESENRFVILWTFFRIAVQVRIFYTSLNCVEKEIHIMRFGIWIFTVRDCRSEVVLLVKSVVFWVITRRRVVIIYRRFGTTYRSHPHGSRFRVGKKVFPVYTL
jgi:hypothetical protein